MPWSWVATAMLARPSPKRSATSTSRMRLNLPPKSFGPERLGAVEAAVGLLAPQLHGGLGARDRQHARDRPPGLVDIALWKTLLCSILDRACTFHSPPWRTRNSRRAGRGLALPGWPGSTARAPPAAPSADPRASAQRQRAGRRASQRRRGLRRRRGRVDSFDPLGRRAPRRRESGATIARGRRAGGARAMATDTRLGAGMAVLSGVPGRSNVPGRARPCVAARAERHRGIRQ